MSKNEFNQRLMSFLDRSPTPFHACQNLAERLSSEGFIQLDERATWQLESGGRYFLTRNDSSLIAWVQPDQPSDFLKGMRMVGAHTDSPCLKLKPQPSLHRQGYLQLGVEVYGGALLNPWFDRDLSIAGRLSYVDTKGDLCSTLVNFESAVAMIPSLAIHLDRDANKGRTINAQTYLPVIIGQSEKSIPFAELLISHLAEQGIVASEVLSFELSLYDCQPASLLGLNKEFLCSARLDNLLSCFIGLESILQKGAKGGSLLVCTDHEEVGSQSACGAAGPMLSQLLERLVVDVETRNRMLASSLLVSVDNAHGIHPNFSDKHDANHGPLLNKGVVIKINANQRYATNSETSAKFIHVANQLALPFQSFVVRSDMGCGSTIGPITAAELGVATIDVGVPQFAMHSIREVAGSDDAYHLSQILAALYATH